MKATGFEYRHQLFLHQMVVAAAVLTYLIDRDDIVWRFIKTAPGDVRSLERGLFAIATILLGISAWLCTWSKANSQLHLNGFPALAGAEDASHSLRHPQYLGEFLYALGLASLVPLSGAFILVVGEAIRLFRLFRRDDPLELAGKSERGELPVGSSANGPQHPASLREPKLRWGRAFRVEALKWGIFVSMIVFTITLRDAVAEVLIGTTVLVWMLLNFASFGRWRVDPHR